MCSLGLTFQGYSTKTSVMKTVIRKRNIARIEVQRNFCQQCGGRIRNALQKIDDIGNVVFYPDSATVVFSFYKANELSRALNVLTELGYPEIGEVPSTENKGHATHCKCHPIEYKA